MKEGYRTEDLYGSGERDLLSVVTHEIEELGNEDVFDYFKEQFGEDKTEEDLFAYLQSLYKKGFVSCVWLCSSIEDLMGSYPPMDGEVKEYGYDVKKYLFDEGDSIAVSDLGEPGKLIAYKKCSIEDMGFVMFSAFSSVS